MEIAQKEKAETLERAVINSSIEEVSKIYDALGYVEMSAPALGLACRFRGLEMVKALVENGATFDYPSTEDIEEKYHCYIGQKSGNYRTNYSLYLLTIFRGELKGACCLKGMKFTKSAKREAGKPLPFLSDNERVAVLHYLYQNKEKLSFEPEEMLFYAIYAKDAAIREALRKLGVGISETRIHTMADGGKSGDGYWYEYGAMTKKLTDEDYMEIMPQLALELGGKPFHFTNKIFDITKNHFYNVAIFEFFLAHFKQEKMKKYDIIRGLIDENALDALPVIEKQGWLNMPKKRDEMIAYASENGKTESLAWLLDFKNRTADFAAEQEKAEKKMMRELNAIPGSVTELKKIWSYKKQEDGTLVITNYKGIDVEVTVPDKIGRSIVTGIEPVAFSGFYPISSWKQSKQHKKITKITLPKTLRYIGNKAFFEMTALKEINIPESIKKIGNSAFQYCRSLKSITIPEGVEEIGEWIFGDCTSLKEITIPGTIKKIKRLAFVGCSMLEKVYICEGVMEIEERAFEKCHKLVIYCPKGSVAEAYCKEKGISFKNSAD